jgi:hypothetical protein
VAGPFRAFAQTRSRGVIGIAGRLDFSPPRFGERPGEGFFACAPPSPPEAEGEGARPDDGRIGL